MSAIKKQSWITPLSKYYSKKLQSGELTLEQIASRLAARKKFLTVTQDEGKVKPELVGKLMIMQQDGINFKFYYADLNSITELPPDKNTYALAE